MKQVFMVGGEVRVKDVPAPVVEPGCVLVAVAYSLISTGTEIVNIGQSEEKKVTKAVLNKAMIKKGVKMLLQKGFRATAARVQQQIVEPSPLKTGYSNAGYVVAAGAGVDGFKAGDRVACAGAGIANHAEFVVVPKNLVVPVPDGCGLRDAASVTLGAIALQGVRRADVRLGENVGVIGLGLVGQITVRLLAASGCRVFGADMIPQRVQKALAGGAAAAVVPTECDPIEAAWAFSDGMGLDAVLVTAASKSDVLMQQAMNMSRKKGRVIIVGDIGLNLKRELFYRKELDVLMSCSYGPGRYDPEYEERGNDYPPAYVRWTENRNMREYVRLIADGRLDFSAIAERVIPVDQAMDGYLELKNGAPPPLAVILQYGEEADVKKKKADTKREIAASFTATKGTFGVALVGAGGLAQAIHLPNIKKLGDMYSLVSIVDREAKVAEDSAKNFGAAMATTSLDDALADDRVNLLLISTRHHLHVDQAIAALRAGKGVILEKPMAMNEEELARLVEAIEQSDAPFMVGFNRRFAPSSQGLKKALSQLPDPGLIIYRVNAGFFPADHWVQGPEGGGRIIGEGCHMIDLISFYTGSRIVSAHGRGIGERAGSKFMTHDNCMITLEYENGWVGSIQYLACGCMEGLGKERIEAHCGGKSFVLDDFKSLKYYGASGEEFSSSSPVKGHFEELKFFAERVRAGERFPIPLVEMVEATQVSFALDHMIRTGDEEE